MCESCFASRAAEHEPDSSESVRHMLGQNQGRRRRDDQRFVSAQSDQSREEIDARSRMTATEMAAAGDCQTALFAGLRRLREHGINDRRKDLPRDRVMLRDETVRKQRSGADMKQLGAFPSSIAQQQQAAVAGHEFNIRMSQQLPM